MHAVLVQTRAPDEVIVIDNASTDRTGIAASHACLEYGGHIVDASRPQWSYVRNERNIGLVANFNRGLAMACPNSDFVHLLMADDLILPTFYERAIEALSEHPAPAMAYCRHDWIDGDGKVACAGVSGASTRIVDKSEFIARHAELKTVSLPGVLLKTDNLNPPCWFRNYPQVTDIMFLAEWAHHSTAIVEIGEVLCQQRMHADNTTTRNIPNIEAWVKDEWRVMSKIHSEFLNGGPVKAAL